MRAYGTFQEEGEFDYISDFSWQIEPFFFFFSLDLVSSFECTRTDAFVSFSDRLVTYTARGDARADIQSYSVAEYTARDNAANGSFRCAATRPSQKECQGWYQNGIIIDGIIGCLDA
jgi:hypothetical protein